MPTSLLTPDYAPPLPVLRRPLFRRILRLGIIVLGLGYVAAAFLTGPAYADVKICARCGELLSMREYRLPLTPIPIYRSHKRLPTAVSRVLAKHGLAATHSDQPVFVQGGGRSLYAPMCALGRRSGLLTVVQDPFTAAFLDNVVAFTDEKTARDWTDRVLGQESKFPLAMELYEVNFPLAGFANQRAFDGWWQTRQAALTRAADRNLSGP